MGALDQDAFDAIVRAGCSACGATPLEIRSFIDRSLVMMAADPENEGRWAHDGEKFVDGTYRIACTSCGHVAFESELCPRCNAAGGLARALAEPSRLRVPKRCPHCNELQLLAVALVPASARGGDKPKQLVDYGDAGYHLVAYACHDCDNAVVAERCPLCDAPGPLRPRP